MNGDWLRALPPDEYADRLVAFLREQGSTGPRTGSRHGAARPGEDRAARRSTPSSPASSSSGVERRRAATPAMLAAAAEALRAVEPFTAEAIEQALRALAERLGLKPRQAFQPIRIAVTGSKISPGLFESIELLGRDETLARLRAAAAAAA